MVMLTTARYSNDITAAAVESNGHAGVQAARSALDARSAQDFTDEALIRAIADGQRSAMHTLYARHSARIYRFVLRLSGDPALSEDIVSEVFLQVWRQANGFQAKSQVATWLLAIARNKAISALRRRTEDALDDDMAAAIIDTSEDAQTAIENTDRSVIVRKCLSQLSADHREVIDLVYYHERSVEEVAEIVGAPVGTVKTRMFYARKHMGKLLAAAGLELN
jgi:RNA polymerase sigma-70 factor, ECF subfamily